MAIERKELKDVGANVRNAFQKAQDVVRKNNIDYGLELLKALVFREPAFADARAALREAQMRKLSSMSGFSKFIASIKANINVIKGKSCITKKPLDAIRLAEEALCACPSCAGAYNLLSEAAQNAGAPFIAIDALESLRSLNPDDENNLRALADLYERNGQGMKVLQIRQIIANKHPGDLEAQAALRSAAALATMSENKMGDDSAMKDAKLKGAQAEREERIVRADDDIKDMIAVFEGKIAEGDKSVDTKRKLAELYQRGARHDDAIAIYEQIIQQLGTLDPSIDKAIEKSKVAIGEAKIEALRAQGASEAQIDAAQNEIYAYRLERAEDRVKTYPNDTQFRYELAVIYWEFQEVDKALEQFQIAQRNPQRRLSSVVFIGQCFSSKGQYDMAVEQFEKALAEMPVMDKEKMNALYYLGQTFESMGQIEKSLDCFKQIYSANVNFRDVAKRIEAGYANQRQQA